MMDTRQKRTHEEKLKREAEAIKSIQQAFEGGDPNEMHAAIEQDIPRLITGYNRLKDLLGQ